MIIGEFATQAAWLCLHVDAKATTWGKSSQASKMRVRISTGMVSIGGSIFLEVHAKKFEKPGRSWEEFQEKISKRFG